MEIKNKFMDLVRQGLRYHRYSLSTEKTCCDWISRYIKYHKSKRHPSEMGKREIEDFLSHLAVDLRVSGGH